MTTTTKYGKDVETADVETAAGAVNKLAQHLLLTGKAKTIEQARIQVRQDNPDLAAAERDEQRSGSTSKTAAKGSATATTIAKTIVRSDKTRADDPLTVLKRGDDRTGSVRALAWQKIVKLGETERANRPQLTPAQARLEVLKTAAGMAWLELYRDKAAHLPVDEFAAKRATRASLTKLGHYSWAGVVSELQKAFAAARPDAAEHTAPENLKWGCERVRKVAPSVWAAYQHECGQ